MSDDGRAETTNKDFTLFKRECRKWINFFGLKEWHITYEHCDMKDANASVNWSVSACTARVKLAYSWDKEVYNNDEIKKSAFHEICHLLLARMFAICNARYVTYDELEESNHQVIRVLENTVFK